MKDKREWLLQLQQLADHMNKVFPHLDAHVEDDVLSFMADIEDNYSDTVFRNALDIHLIPHYPNLSRDKAYISAEVFGLEDEMPENMNFAINPERVL